MRVSPTALRHEHGVPPPYSRQVSVVAQDAERCCIEKEVTSRRGRKSKPPSGKDSENMTVREKGDISLHRADSRDQPIGPRADLSGAFPSWTAVGEDHPSGRLRIDLFRSQAFVFAIVPFHQITIDFCVRAETG